MFRNGRGHDAVRHYFSGVAELEFHRFEPRLIVEQGDTVLVDLAIDVAHRGTGKSTAYEEIHRFRVGADGRICAYRPFLRNDQAAGGAAGRGGGGAARPRGGAAPSSMRPRTAGRGTWRWSGRVPQPGGGVCSSPSTMGCWARRGWPKIRPPERSVRSVGTMPVQLDVIGLVVADMARSLAFYRKLGLDLPPDADAQPHVEAALPGGLRLAWDTVETIRSFDPDWSAASGGPRMSLAFACDTPAEVDATYARLVGAGLEGHLAPFDAFWGQRYATSTTPTATPSTCSPRSPVERRRAGSQRTSVRNVTPVSALTSRARCGWST